MQQEVTKYLAAKYNIIHPIKKGNTIPTKISLNLKIYVALVRNSLLETNCEIS
jgi:hypothetical protein